MRPARTRKCHFSVMMNDIMNISAKTPKTIFRMKRNDLPRVFRNFFHGSSLMCLFVCLFFWGSAGDIYQVLFSFAVLRDAMRILFNSTHLSSMELSPKYPHSVRSSSQYSVSEHSFKAMCSFAIKSAFPCA